MPRKKLNDSTANTALSTHLEPTDKARDSSNAAPSQHLAVVETAAEREFNERRELAIAEFGDGLPYSREHYIAESRRDMRTAAEAAVRIGRRLLVMKECEPHGTWLGCLAEVGLEPATAQRMMAAARRLAALPNAATAQHLIESAGHQSKLFELLALPADQFAELAEDGETGGLDLDDIKDMTVRELRAALRDARADIDAKDERAGKREQQIDNLEKRLRKAKGDALRATPDEVAADMRTRCQMAALQVRADILSSGGDDESLRTRVAALCEHGGETGEDHAQFLGGLIAELMTTLRIVRDEFGLPIVNDLGAE